ncbi:protein boule [Anaeramoeba flamelloides]|uniref:Protein boule n=1 Tax=Anaeramoeba flamelloides TaxID=1746091 RepID=A0AAV7YZJ2_9EUKA|nr:protein boule [Anaeramoeba flamelloides]KAJ6240405.1 protein boule [Anaeramoeba flamelloides]
MTNKESIVFVGGLNPQDNEEFLKEVFSQFGTVVSTRVIKDQYNNQSKQFGFVTFETVEDAQKVQSMEHIPHKGRVMNVGEAVRKPPTDISYMLLAVYLLQKIPEVQTSGLNRTQQRKLDEYYQELHKNYQEYLKQRLKK